MGVVQVVVYLLVGLEGKLLWLSVCMGVDFSRIIQVYFLWRWCSPLFCCCCMSCEQAYVFYVYWLFLISPRVEVNDLKTLFTVGV